MRLAPTLFAVLLFAAPPATAQFPVADTPGPLPATSVSGRVFFTDTTNDAVYVAQDVNGDGDANDAGEIEVYYDDSSPNIDLGLPKTLIFGPDGALYIGDSSTDVILRLQDTDGDGNANGPNDSTIFFDSSSSTPAFTSLTSMRFDGAGYLFFTDSATSSGNQSLVRIRDDNGDGYCSQAAGEVFFIHEQATTGGVAGRWGGMAIDANGTLIAMEYGLPQDDIYRLVDINGDGDANDVGEQILYFAEDPTGSLITLTYVENLTVGYEIPGQGTPMWVNNYTEDQFLRFLDTNGDGVITNDTEVTVFWDTTALGVVPGITWGFALDPSGKIYIGEGGSTSAGIPDSMVILEDLTGDGDANDMAEAVIFLDDSNAGAINFGTIRGIALEPDTGTLPPALFGLSPSVGGTGGGTTVTLSGANFTPADSVTFAGLPASVVSTTLSQLVVTTPAHAAGPVDVTVTNLNGSATLPGGFTYRDRPVLVNVAPSSGPATGGTIVILTGTAFTGGANVTFDGLPAAVTFDSPTQLTVTTPPHPGGAVDVTVTNAAGSSTLVGGFVYDTPPVLTSLIPMTGPASGGTTVTLTGTGFTASDSVTFDGIAAASFTFDSPTQLTVSTPAHAEGAVDVTVSNVLGSSTLAMAFTYGTPFPELVRGDCNGDGGNNIADPVFLLGYLFPGMASPNTIDCFDACDGNDDESLNIADAIAMLGALFGSPTVPLPAPNACGQDPSAPTDDPVLDLDCVQYPNCP